MSYSSKKNQDNKNNLATGGGGWGHWAGRAGGSCKLPQSTPAGTLCGRMNGYSPTFYSNGKSGETEKDSSNNEQTTPTIKPKGKM